MKARDVMVSPVITVTPDTLVGEVAKLLLEHRFSAVPVVDHQGKLVGIISEGDLMHRAEAGTERQRSWWLRGLTGADTLAFDYIKAHARKVADVMTRQVVTASADTPLNEIATLMEKNAIKRIPIVAGGQLVGIITRANLMQAVASAPKGREIQPSDTAIRDRLLAHLKAQPWAETSLLNVTVSDGTVDLWGITNSEAERKAICVAAESAPGVRAVRDNMMMRPKAYWS